MQKNLSNIDERIIQSLQVKEGATIWRELVLTDSSGGTVDRILKSAPQILGPLALVSVISEATSEGHAPSSEAALIKITQRLLRQESIPITTTMELLLEENAAFWHELVLVDSSGGAVDRILENEHQAQLGLSALKHAISAASNEHDDVVRKEMLIKITQRLLQKESILSDDRSMRVAFLTQNDFWHVFVAYESSATAVAAVALRVGVLMDTRDQQGRLAYEQASSSVKQVKRLVSTRPSSLSLTKM